MLIKSYTLFFLITLLIIGVDNGFSAGVLDITTEEITPGTVEPGKDITVQVRINNPLTSQGGDSEVFINSISAKLDNNFDLISTSGISSFEESKLCSGCSRTVTFFLQAKSNLNSGIYPVEIEIEHDKAKTSKKDVMINVEGRPDIFQTYNISEKNIVPGQSFDVSINLTNVGSGKAKDIRISSLSDTIGLMGENFIYIDKLHTKESVTLDVEFVTSKDIDTGYTQVPVSLEYYDTLGNKIEDEEKVGLDFKDKSNIVIQNLRISPNIKEKEKFDLNLRLENIGDGEAKNVVASIDGSFLGLKDGFFGKMKRDDDLLYIFELIPAKSGDIPVTINIQYEDDFGTHTTTQEINVSVKENYSSFYILGGLIVTVLLIMGYLIVVHKKTQKRYQ